MSKKYWLIVVTSATVIAMISCNNDNGKIDDILDPPPITKAPVAVDTTQAVTVSQVVTTTDSAVKLNPAHGEPGHRCEIAVGAPLNSAPPVTTTTQKNGVALNPAHGQPGHRCDIAVGAPLNSAPVVTSAKPDTTKNQPATIAFNKPVYNFDTTGKGPLNPPHGQPGHRCDIAVGAPLNSPPNGKAITVANDSQSAKTDSSGSAANTVQPSEKDSVKKQ